MRVNSNIRPPTGYQFVDEDQVTHEAKDVETLAKNLSAYRARIKRPPGDPLKEINEQICKRSPQSCVQDSPEYNGKGLAARVVATLARWAREIPSRRTRLTDATEAARRAAICRACPLNVEWAKFCPPCRKKSTAILEHLLKPGKPIAALRGRACLNAGDDLSVAVFVTEGPLVKSAPADCWRKE